MKIAILVAPGKIEIRDRDIPVPAQGELLLSVQYALTCGTTLKAFQRGHPKIKMPGPFGHEFSGIVDLMGDGVVSFSKQDRVVCLHTFPCTLCRFCLRGQTNLCVEFDSHVNFGAYAEKILIPKALAETYCFKIPDSVSFARAAFLQSVSCVVHGFNLLKLEELETLCILGAGSFAVLFAMLAKERGFSPVILGRNSSKCAALRNKGFVCESDFENAKKHWKGHSPQVVVEAVGSSLAWEQAVQWVEPGGKILWFGGLPGNSVVHLDHKKIHYEEITVQGAFHYTPKDVLEAKLLLFEKLDPTFLIAESLPLSHLEQAFQNMIAGKGQKYAIVP
jgi:L-iditol 2-dehydrogenase